MLVSSRNEPANRPSVSPGLNVATTLHARLGERIGEPVFRDGQDFDLHAPGDLLADDFVREDFDLGLQECHDNHLGLAQAGRPGWNRT